MHLMRQKSESKLFRAIELLRPKEDTRPLLIAYGAWGLKPGTICRKGNPPALGVGMARKLSKQFRVIWTLEFMTSKTCLSCSSRCGRCAWLELSRPLNKRGKVPEIRGLRQCLNPNCGPKSGHARASFQSRPAGCDQHRRQLGSASQRSPAHIGATGTRPGVDGPRCRTSHQLELIPPLCSDANRRPHPFILLFYRPLHLLPNWYCLVLGTKLRNP